MDVTLAAFPSPTLEAVDDEQMLSLSRSDACQDLRSVQLSLSGSTVAKYREVQGGQTPPNLIVIIENVYMHME